MDPAQWELLDAVDRICRTYPASVTSWWRTAKRNQSLPGSVKNSQHMHGLAIDLVFDGTQPTKAQLQPYMGPSMQIVTQEPGHVHIEQDPRMLLARGSFPASVTSPSFSPSGSLTQSSIASALCASTPARTVDAPSRTTASGGRSPLDRLSRGKRRRG